MGRCEGWRVGSGLVVEVWGGVSCLGWCSFLGLVGVVWVEGSYVV